MEAFPTWAHLAQVHFAGVKLQDVGHGKGLGLVVAAESDVKGSAVEEQKRAVLRVPHDLVLSVEAVDEYGKVDHNFKQLLDIAGRKVRSIDARALLFPIAVQRRLVEVHHH